ncbi:vitellogenin receptor-like isoform X2 [Linepithema humile]
MSFAYLLFICSFLWISVNSSKAEHGSSGKIEASSKICQHIKTTLTGHACFCPPGYKLQENNTCTDIDECQTYGICDQGCENLPGSYKCFCHPDYSLQDDKKTCIADGQEAILLFSTKTDIFEYYFGSQKHFNVVKNLDHIVDVVVNEDYLYWSEVKGNESSVIKRFNIHTREKHETIIAGLHKVTSLAVDWITGNIYFTDSGYFRIGACNDKGTYCTVVIDTHNREPRSLVLLPTKGLMYYFEEEINVTKEIKVVGMDGKNMTTLFKPEFFTEALAIDYPNNRLYWLTKGAIQSVKLDGTDERKILYFPSMSAISFTVFENKLYWSDSEYNSIRSCDKFFGKDCKILLRTMNNAISYGMHIDHPAMKSKVSNPCHTNPCSQLCLLNRNNSYTCACSMDYILDTDRHTCLDGKKQYLVIIAGNTFINYYYKILGTPKVTTSTVSNNISITEAIYDQLTGTILAIDQYNHYVIRYDPKDGNITNLISIEDMIVGGMAFDYIGNNVYLSNLKHRSIEVHSLTTKKNTIFYFLSEEPHSIETVPTKGIMFVTFKTEISFFFNLQKLRGINMNGLSGEKFGAVVLADNADNADSSRLLLRYDLNSSTLFTNYKCIVLHMVEPIKCKTTSNSAAVSFDVTEDSIFWTEHNSTLLYRKTIRQTIFDDKHIVLTMPVDKVENPLVVNVRGMVIHKKKGCLQNNGNCSHVCLPSSLQSFICACPPEMALSADNRTCIVPTCPILTIKCSEHDVCIKPEQWCDGHKDCPNGEDEESNCKESGICEENEFMCNDHTCINANKRCNFHIDCIDKSDEQNCSEKQCKTGEFRCHTGGRCIPPSLVCNGFYDCPDLSDEEHCVTHKCSSDEFMCDMGKCIPKNWKCDNELDCPDGSDEAEDCHFKNICGPDYYECANGRCISNSLICNHINDCVDYSDEKYCTRSGYSRNCTENEYLCMNSGICVSKKAKCNGIQDCPRNDDEFRCAYCFKNEFKCKNQKCISKKMVCNNVDDCGDNSDETDCSNDKKNPKDCNQFKCTNGICLSFNKVCDGIKDCPDGSDEKHRSCSIACQNAKCEDLCHNTPNGTVCSCRSGYSLDSDGISCNDINECQQNVCSQKCVNTVGSYECSCIDEYSLRTDKISCKSIGPQMQFITTTLQNLWKISADGSNSVEVVHDGSLISIIDIVTNARDDAVYWSDGDGAILKIDVETQEILTIDGLTAGNLAVDWITNNVYYSVKDIFQRNLPIVIGVCNFEQQKCAVVIRLGYQLKITTLAVNPLIGYIFWFREDGPEGMGIWRANLMGTDIKKIVSRSDTSIINMAIDHIRSRLYWMSMHNNTIESCNYNGDACTTDFLITKGYEVSSVDIFEDSIYWLISSPFRRLQKCKLYGDKACTIVNINDQRIAWHFSIFQIAKNPPAENPCEEHNCDHMCVLSHDEFGVKRAACICPDGSPIESNSICSKSVYYEIILSLSVIAKYIKENFNAIMVEILVVIGGMVLVVGALSGIYYFYKKYGFELTVVNSNSSKDYHSTIQNGRCQQVSFNRTLGTVVISDLDSTASSDKSLEEYEYVNPIADELSETQLIVQ